MAGRTNVYRTEQNDGNAPASGALDYSGPTYGDVRSLCMDLERVYARSISFLVDAADCGRRWEGRAMHVRVVARLGSDFYKGAIYASASFGGNGGSKTLPGAMVAALHELWEVLEAGGMFPDEPSR